MKLSGSYNMEQEFTKVIDLIYLAKQDGIEIVLNDERLQLKIPDNKTIDKNLLQEIKDHRSQIIDFLSNENWKSKTVNKNHKKIGRFDREVVKQIPLSFSQERLWFIDKLEGSLQYHLPTVLRLRGNLNREALEFALQAILTRHESLRTIFTEQDGQPSQFVKDEKDWELEIIDGFNYKDQPQNLHTYIDALIKKPFDLSKDYMMRAELIKIDELEHVVVVTMHHIASDAWSLPIIVREVVELYTAFDENRKPNLAPLDLQYADYAVWQRKYLQGDLLDNKIAYWKNKLEGVAPLQLPTDYPRPAIRTTKGAITSFTIDKELSDAIKLLSQQQGTSLFMTLLAAFKALLHRYSGQSDISVGTSIAGRLTQDIEGLIGFFANTLALRTEVSSDASFIELLQKVRTTTLDAYEHQEVSFEKVVETVMRDRDPSRSPLFQVMLVLHNTPDVPTLQLGELQLSYESFDNNISKFDITFFMANTSKGLQGSVQYRTELFSEATMKRMIGHFKELLSSIVQFPQQKIGSLSILSESEHKQLLSFNHSKVEYPKDKTIVDLFEAQAVLTPDDIAIVFEEHTLTYKTLNERSNQLAHYLRSRGVKEDSLVPLCVERSHEMMVGMLGILKAGAAYVPVEPDFPEERKAFVLEDTDATVVVSSVHTSSKLPYTGDIDIIEVDGEWSAVKGQPKNNLQTGLKPGNLAYVIYTSGSTGKPKGVMIEHGNLVDYVFGLKQATQIDQCRSYALVSSIATDLGNTVIYTSLVFGGALHVFSKESVSNIEYLHNYFNRHVIEGLKIVPSHWKALSLDGNLLLPSRLMVFGGEALQSELVEDIRMSRPGCTVVNHYGPTETTIGKLLHVIKQGRAYNQTIPVGKPFSNTAVYVLSKDGGLCPVGIPGELHIAGDGVARGYLNNDELTAVKFIQDPFNSKGNSLMYRTGDLVRYLEDGNIEFIGRVDDQVKIRGYRIELGEIENILQQCDEVSQGVVLAREDKQGNKRLIAYIIPEGWFDKDAIVSYLNEKLPEYMVPALFVELENFPLLPNGKVDRKALPDPDVSEVLLNQYEAPRNEIEEKLAAIWQDVLEVERVGINDDFFELGGHSLLAVRLISAIRRELEVEMAIGDIFDHTTIKLLASHLQTIADKVMMPSVKEIDPRPERIPLSFSQERLWFIDKLEGSVQYHRPSVLQLKGKLNAGALEHAFKTIINRHEVLRTVMLEQDGSAWQHIKEQDGFQLPIVEGSGYSHNHKDLQQHLATLIKTPFDLSKDDMLRASLIKIAEEDHVLVVTMHHIASDGWSISILVKEVVELYESYISDRPAQLPELKVQYADYAIWQREYLQGEVLEKKLSYWKDKLQGVAPLELPTDYRRPPIASRKGAATTFTVDKGVSNKLQAFSQQHGATMFMTLLAAFKVLLHRYSGQQDICVGTPVAGRQQQELESLIGFFINTLALRTDVDSNASFVDLLQQIKQNTMEAYEHQEVPFEKVVDVVVNKRDMSRNPIFQVMFILQNTPEVPHLRFGDVELSRKHFEHTTSLFDITFTITETSAGLQGGVEYSTDLYSELTIKQMVMHFNQLLKSIVSNPLKSIGTLPMLTEEDKHQLLIGFNNTALEYPRQQTIIDLFEQQVTAIPKATALVFENKKITYGELDQKANQLAHYLKNKGVREESLVPICMERSIEMIISIWGVLKAGAAYVPIDPSYPADRIEYLLSDINASVLITLAEGNSIPNLNINIKKLYIDKDWPAIAQQPVEKLAVNLTADNLCYIIYTSGSTGKPKGVMIEHKGLLASTLSRKHYYKNAGSVFLVPSFAFDSSVAVIFGTLAMGGTLILSKSEAIKDVQSLKQMLRQADTILCVPSYYRFLLQERLVQESPLLNVIVAGEKLEENLVSEHYKETKNTSLYNEYGPTEGTVWSTVAEIKTANDLVTIGKPINTVAAYIVDKNLQLVPVGVAGELCIGGVQVARGYLNLPELTNEKFIRNPFTTDDTKMYRTGDMARWMPDGNIEYLGRTDDQVKIRGYRIELGEIEEALQQIEGIKQAVVVVKEPVPGNKQLVAFIVSDNFNQETFRNNLKTRLPDYMVPALWIALDSLPLTANGKIDKKALAETDTAGMLSDSYVVPRNEVEITLVQIWQKLLGVERIGIEENFFDIGGHSMLAVQLISAIRKEFSLEIPLKDIFERPTVEMLAGYIQKYQESNASWSSGMLTEKEIEAIAERLERIGLNEPVHFGGKDGKGKYMIPIQKEGIRSPLFGLIFFDQVRTLGKYIGKNQPLYYLPPVQSAKVEDVAAHYVKEIKQLKPEGPYSIAGYCGGGKVAIEIAQQLKAMGDEVSALLLFEFYSPKAALSTKSLKYKKKRLAYYMKRVKTLSKSGLTPLDILKFLFKKSYSKVAGTFDEPPPPNRLKSAEFLNYQCKPYTGKVILFQASNPPLEINDSPLMGWADHFTGDVKLITVQGGHLGIFREPAVKNLAEVLSDALEKVNRETK